MKKNRIYLLILFCFIILLIFFNKVDFNCNNIKDINYTMLEFKSLDINKAKLNRYNELINIPQVSFLIRNLSSVLEGDNINEEMTIVFCYNYAINFRNDSAQYIIQDSQNTYIDCAYIESIIYELFNRTVDMSEYKQKNGYLIISENNLKTDTIEIEVEEILYCEQYDVYKIMIREYDQNIEIIYKYNDGKYVLLLCLEGI